MQGADFIARGIPQVGQVEVAPWPWWFLANTAAVCQASFMPSICGFRTVCEKTNRAAVPMGSGVAVNGFAYSENACCGLIKTTSLGIDYAGFYS